MRFSNLPSFLDIIKIRNWSGVLRLYTVLDSFQVKMTNPRTKLGQSLGLIICEFFGIDPMILHLLIKMVNGKPLTSWFYLFFLNDDRRELPMLLFWPVDRGGSLLSSFHLSIGQSGSVESSGSSVVGPSRE